MQNFQQQQLDFIRRIKDPTAPLPAGIRPERMAVYEALFFNNLQNFINSAFPVLLSIVPAEQWQALCRQFFREHALHSPYFLHISQEFLRWLPQVAERLPCFASELAHYEWLELDLATDQAETIPGWCFDAATPLALAPLSRLGAYQYPVQHISVHCQPSEPAEQPIFLLLYRDQTDGVRFLELNAWSAALIQLIQAEPGQVISTYLDWLQPYVPQWDSGALLPQATALLSDFAERGIIARFTR